MSKRVGAATILMENKISVTSFSAVGGKKEGEGPMRDCFDYIDSDDRFGQNSFEEAESAMQGIAMQNMLEKRGIEPKELSMMFGGDLLNQCIGTSFGVFDFRVPYIGIYGACFKIAVVMVMFTQAFRYAYEPFIFARNKSDDNKKAYSEAMKYFIIFALLIFLGVMFYIDILKYFVGPAYYPGLRVVPIVMLGELFFGIYFNLSLWYKLTDQTYWGAYFSAIGCVATVAIILLFGPRYGYMACAWASFACNLIMMLLSYFIGQKKYPIQYDLKSALAYTALAAVLYAASTLKLEPSWLQYPYRTMLLAIYIIVMVKRDLPLQEIPYIGKYFNKKSK